MTVMGVLLSVALPLCEVAERPDYRATTCPGRVTPIAQVDVKPQVTGEILEVCFTNGQFVVAGDVLYRLDSVKYAALVKNAEAKVAESKANLEYAERSFERHRKLLETRAVSADAYDNARSQRDSSRAAFAAAEADLVAARDDLKHCTITAPISGKVGSTEKTKGNYVTAGSLTLVSIVQLDPIRVKFSLSNREILDIVDSGARKSKDDVSITLMLANGKPYDRVGLVEYSDNQSDETTDTVMIYSSFANPESRLVPGGTVSVSLSSKSGVRRIAVPATSIMQDVQGPYVWAVKEDGMPERRSIARGDLTEDGWVFVEKGLSVGERIVANGAHRVRKGEKVEEFKR